MTNQRCDDPNPSIDSQRCILDPDHGGDHFDGDWFWTTIAPFGFTVVGVGEGNRGRVGDRYWQVYLPHQCDEWDIVDTTDGFQALNEMEAFVKQATAALDALRKRVVAHHHLPVNYPHPPDSPDTTP